MEQISAVWKDRRVGLLSDVMKVRLKAMRTGRSLHAFALLLIQRAMNWLIRNFFAISLRSSNMFVLRYEHIAIDILSETKKRL
ncbi:hypothetical protein ASE07_26270 [Noviherbaspirillum sp. Root189]|nr:hypothetical protein ASE07_26270 [Noviherbaspirillum sp. Root189]